MTDATIATTTQWQAHRDKWLAEAPARHELQFARSHRRPSRWRTMRMANIVAAIVAAMALMFYATGTLAMTGAPLLELFPAMAAFVLSGVLMTAGMMSRTQD